MKKTPALTTLCALILTITSCHKHEVIIEPEVVVTGTDIKALFNQNLEDIKVIEPFDAEKGINYALLNRATIQISPDCLVDLNQAKAVGKAELTFIEIYDRGTMLVTNKPTVAEDNGILNFQNTNNALYNLQTGGMVYASVTQNNKELSLSNGCPLIIKIPTTISRALTASVPANMYMYTGNLDNNEAITWKTPITFTTDATSYTMSSETFGMKGALGTANSIESFNNVTFERPTGLNDNNSRIFVALEGYKNALGTEKVSIPQDTRLHYILVVGNGDNFKYAIKSQTSSSETIKFTADELKDATSQQLIKIANDLP